MSNGISYVMSSSIVVKQGDDRKSSDGLSYSFTNQAWSYGVSSISVLFYRGNDESQIVSINKDGSWDNSTKTASFELTALESKTLKVGLQSYNFSVVATLSSNSKITLVSGNVDVVSGIV